MIGRRLEQAFKDEKDIKVYEFIGSPLDLVTKLSGFKKVIIVDSIISGKLKPGTIIVFRQKEILSQARGRSPHSINLAEALALARRLGMDTPRSLILVGIEVGKIVKFGEGLTPELKKREDEIYRNVLTAVKELI